MKPIINLGRLHNRFIGVIIHQNMYTWYIPHCILGHEHEYAINIELYRKYMKMFGKTSKIACIW